MRCFATLARILCWHVPCENRGWRKFAKLYPFPAWLASTFEPSQGFIEVNPKSETTSDSFAVTCNGWPMNSAMPGIPEFELCCAGCLKSICSGLDVSSSWYEEVTKLKGVHMCCVSVSKLSRCFCLKLEIPSKSHQFHHETIDVHTKLIVVKVFADCFLIWPNNLSYKNGYQLQLQEPHSSGDHCQISGAKLMREVVSCDRSVLQCMVGWGDVICVVVVVAVVVVVGIPLNDEVLDGRKWLVCHRFSRVSCMKQKMFVEATGSMYVALTLLPPLVLELYRSSGCFLEKHTIQVYIYMDTLDSKYIIYMALLKIITGRLQYKPIHVVSYVNNYIWL